MGHAAKQVNATNFEDEVVKAASPVLVDFWAEWCGPCRMIGPVLEELAAEMDGKIAVAKVNVDESPTLATQYSVRSIPTLVIMKQGQVVATKIGALPKQALKTWIEENI